MSACRCFVPALAALALLLVPVTGRAQTPPATPGTADVRPLTTTAPSAAPQPAAGEVRVGMALPATAAPLARHRALTPLMADLQVVLDREQVQLAALDAERRKAPDAMAALDVQRRIEQLKQQTEIELLRVQATHARRNGRTAVAQRIDAAIAELSQPRPRLEPIERPAPARDGAGR